MKEKKVYNPVVIRGELAGPAERTHDRVSTLIPEPDNAGGGTILSIDYRKPFSGLSRHRERFFMCGEIENAKECKTAGLPDKPIEASVALQVLPWVPMDDVYAVVDRVIEYIKETGVTYHVGPFETTMEGSLEMLLDIVKHAQHIAIEMGAPEVISFVKISYRLDETGSAGIESKIGKHRH